MARDSRKSKNTDALAEATSQLAQATVEAAAINRRGSVHAAKINSVAGVVAAVVVGSCGVTGVGIQGYFATEQARTSSSAPARLGAAGERRRPDLGLGMSGYFHHQDVQDSDEDLYLTTSISGKNLLVVSASYAPSRDLVKWEGFGRHHGALSVNVLHLPGTDYSSLKAAGILDLDFHKFVVVAPTMTA